MYTYKLTIEYDGTPFIGYQIQRGRSEPTVQGELQGLLSKLFDEPLKTYCAGRTDTGVHALEQVVHFKSERLFNLPLLHRALDGLIHRAISVRKIEFAPPEFHARHSAIRRRYLYVVDNSPHPDAFLMNHAYWIHRPMDVEAMKLGCSYLQGFHDFSLFIKDVHEVEKKERTLEIAEIYSGSDIEVQAPLQDLRELFGVRKNLVIFYFQAPSFAHSQVRLMVGNLLFVGMGNMPPGDIQRMLQLDRTVKSKAYKLPGRGLYLAGVDYPDEYKEIPS